MFAPGQVEAEGGMTREEVWTGRLLDGLGEEWREGYEKVSPGNATLISELLL